MKFEIGCAIIQFCKEYSFDEFRVTFKLDEVFKALDLPIAKPLTLYNFLRGALYRKLDSWEELSLLSTSKGNQEKYYSSEENAFIKLRFYYDNKYWNDFLVEVISSKVFASLPTGVSVLKQLPVWTNKGWGCYSKNFCNNGKFLSFENLLETNRLRFTDNDRYRYVLDVYAKYNIDATTYIDTMIVLDAVVLNEDRHLNNFGILYKDGAFTLPPIFDNGLGLFEHDYKYSYVTELGVALRKAKAKPFNVDFFKSVQKNVSSASLSTILKGLYIPDDLYVPNSLAARHLNSVKQRLEVFIND